MSSFIRTICKTIRIVREDNGDRVVKSNGSHYAGRGSKLGTKNPKDPCRPGVAKKKPKVWRARHKVNPAKLKPRQTLGEPVRLVPLLTKAQRREAHRDRMLAKDRQRVAIQRAASRPERVSKLLGTSAGINRNTGKPHKHAAERARRTRQAGGI